jgi:alginate O-acetyltransferase complex protein AlgI
VSFVSVEFIVLLSITLSLYYLPPCRKWQPLILITASFVFYGYGKHYRPLLLGFCVLINFLAGYVCLSSQNKKLRISSAVAGIACNLLTLASFKYGRELAHFLGSHNLSVGEVGSILGDLTLPIGLSFFTLQGISLVIDAFRNKIDRQFKKEETKGLLEYGNATALFTGFFPTLLSGPILKGHEFIPQISAKYFKDIDGVQCVKGLVLGYFLKMVIADNLKDQTFWMDYPYHLGFSSVTLLTMLFGYSMQIFADFCGYSLIAIAIARLLGYEVPINFNFPYISTTFSEFWRRWHIALSTWLRDYLYFPLGGNRKGSLRTYFNLFVVMVLGGLWHGSTWNYVLWGVYHGTLLILERPFRDRLEDMRHPCFNLLKWVVVFTLVSFGWLFFKLTDFGHALSFMKALWTNMWIANDMEKIQWILVYCVPVGLYHLLHLIRSQSSALNIITDDWLYALMLFAIICCSGNNSTFIYFQF